MELRKATCSSAYTNHRDVTQQVPAEVRHFRDLRLLAQNEPLETCLAQRGLRTSWNHTKLCWMRPGCVLVSCLWRFTDSCSPKRRTLPKASGLRTSLVFKTMTSSLSRTQSQVGVAVVLSFIKTEKKAIVCVVKTHPVAVFSLGAFVLKSMRSPQFDFPE